MISRPTTGFSQAIVLPQPVSLMSSPGLAAGWREEVRLSSPRVESVASGVPDEVLARDDVRLVYLGRAPETADA